jgi:hypothetical protein
MARRRASGAGGVAVFPFGFELLEGPDWVRSADNIITRNGAEISAIEAVAGATEYEDGAYG